MVQVRRSRKPFNAIYNLHGKVLETVSCAKCLGVDVSSNLSLGSHIDRIANKTLGFVKRNIKTKMPAVRGSLYRYFFSIFGKGPYGSLVSGFDQCLVTNWKNSL